MLGANCCKFAAPALITAEGSSEGSWLTTLLDRPLMKTLLLIEAASALDS